MWVLFFFDIWNEEEGGNALTNLEKEYICNLKNNTHIYEKTNISSPCGSRSKFL